MINHLTFIGLAELAISFVESDAESQAQIEEVVYKFFDRYSSERDNLLQAWNTLLENIKKHKQEKGGEPLFAEEVFLKLLR